MALVVRSKSAEGQTIAALLPPSSNKFLPSLFATIGASALPISQLPVAENSAIPSSSANAIAASLPPKLTKTKSLCSSAMLSHISLTRWAQPSLWGLGFQIILLPHTAARQKFQPNTATGKLNAVTHPTTPKGCHISCSRWFGLSLGIVRPYSCLLKPVAKSHISMTSWTSPSPSEIIFLASVVIC